MLQSDDMKSNSCTCTRVFAQSLAGCVIALLSAGAAVVVYRFRWRPIRARGGLTLLLNLSGAVIWVAASAVPLEAEGVSFDIADPIGWELWLGLVFGFGYSCCCILLVGCMNMLLTVVCL